MPAREPYERLSLALLTLYLLLSFPPRPTNVIKEGKGSTAPDYARLDYPAAVDYFTCILAFGITGSYLAERAHAAIFRSQQSCIFSDTIAKIAKLVELAVIVLQEFAQSL